MPRPGKTSFIKFPPSRGAKAVKCPGYARGGCLSFDLTDTLHQSLVKRLKSVSMRKPGRTRQNQAGGDTTQNTDFAHTWHQRWVW